MKPITLTFDNGPEPDVTPGVLDTLSRQNVPATFFVLGRKLADAACRRLAERAAAEGHWIGNHTFTHGTPLGRLDDPGTPENEIGRTQNLLGGLSHPDRLFRPFGGGGALGQHLLSGDVLRYLEKGAYTCVLWNVIPRDWDTDTNTEWPERALALMAPVDWPLVVVHDLPTGAMAHLDRFIETARAQGFEFRQDFPPDCVPLVRGRAERDMSPFVTDVVATS